MVFRTLPPLRDNGYAICTNPGAWEPRDADVAELERRLALPRQAGPLNTFVRYYAGIYQSGVRLIRGQFVKIGSFAEFRRPERHIVSELEFPLIADGGCGVVNVEYNPQTRATRVFCNGV